MWAKTEEQVLGLEKVSARAEHSTIKLTADPCDHVNDEAEERMTDAIDQNLGPANA